MNTAILGILFVLFVGIVASIVVLFAGIVVLFAGIVAGIVVLFVGWKSKVRGAGDAPGRRTSDDRFNRGIQFGDHVKAPESKRERHIFL